MAVDLNIWNYLQKSVAFSTLRFQGCDNVVAEICSIRIEIFYSASPMAAVDEPI